MRNYFLLVIFFSSLVCIAQEEEIDPDGYNIFYYPNSRQISSEGFIKNGKPDGYWKTYYVTGIKKSEGNRRNFLLDSIWVFYNQVGDTIERISYVYGKKNGYYYTYEYKSGVTSQNRNIISKELYVNDKKEGLSYYYYNDGKIHNVVNYVNGRKQGLAKEYSKGNVIITLLEYHNNVLIDRQRINRKDKNELKQGVWKDFNNNGKLSVERSYKDDLLHGLYREYDHKGDLILAIKYSEGKIVEENVEDNKTVEIKREYDKNGNLISTGPFRKNVPIGIHRKYSSEGEVVSSKIYDDNGNVVSVGIVNEKGEKLGAWKNYYSSGEKRSEGEYIRNQQSGKWTYYFKNGAIEQKGSFRSNKPEGLWTWYHKNGNILREEEYYNGKEDGISIEYSENGDLLEKGDYLEGEKEGKWLYNVGDHTEEGKYIVGLREGIWKYFYANGAMKYIGNYKQGNTDGKHKKFWENGNLKEEQFYSMGIRERTWKKYNQEGNLIMTITFRNDVEYRINGIKVKLPESDVKLIK